MDELTDESSKPTFFKDRIDGWIYKRRFILKNVIILVLIFSVNQHSMTFHLNKFDNKRINNF